MKNNWQKTVAAILMLVVMITVTISAVYNLFTGNVSLGLFSLAIPVSWVLAIWGEVKEQLAEESSGEKNNEKGE